MSDKGKSKEDHDDEGSSCSVDQKKNKSFRRKIKRAKQMVLLPVKKFKKFYKCSSGDYHGKSCHLCFMRPSTPDSPDKPQPDDPSSYPEFSYEFMKALIEGNDFYAKDCNVHRDL